MGRNGNKGRKLNDSPTPRVPAPAAGTGGTGSGAVAEQSPAARCRPAFELTLIGSAVKLLPGMKLNLKVVKSDQVEVYYLNQKVRDLPKDLALEISWCLDKKFRYPGEVIERQKKLYGQFRRSR